MARDFSRAALEANGVLGKGGGGKAVSTDAVVRYVAGVVTRERARLARILAASGVSPEVQRAIMDDADDYEVFKWVSPAGAATDEA